MKSKLFMAVPFLALMSLLACSGGGGGGGGGTSGACTLSQGGTVSSCHSFTGLTSEQASAQCSSAAGFTSVASCPSANQVGSCQITLSASGTSYSYTTVSYGVNGTTCASAKQACSAFAASGSITSSFTGSGC